MGARAVLQGALRLNDPLSRWALALQQRRGYHRACIAIAAKNARIAWASWRRIPLPSPSNRGWQSKLYLLLGGFTRTALVEQNRSDRRSRNQINLRAEIAA